MVAECKLWGKRGQGPFLLSDASRGVAVGALPWLSPSDVTCEVGYHAHLPGVTFMLSGSLPQAPDLFCLLRVHFPQPEPDTVCSRQHCPFAVRGPCRLPALFCLSHLQRSRVFALLLHISVSVQSQNSFPGTISLLRIQHTSFLRGLPCFLSDSSYFPSQIVWQPSRTKRASLKETPPQKQAFFLNKIFQFCSVFQLLKHQCSICLKSRYFLVLSHFQLAVKSSSIGEPELPCTVN